MSADANRVELAADVAGAGPVIVLLHGITENARSWDPLIASLAQDHTLIAVDLRGHGRSPMGETYDSAIMAEDVHALLDRLGLGGPDPLVIGHSMGGLIAVAYAAAHATRGVIVVEQSLDLAGLKGQLLPLEPMLRGDRFADAFATVFEALLDPLPADQGARICALRRPDQEVVLGVWAPLFDLTPDALHALVRRVVRGIDAPVLSLHGIDPGPAYADWLRERIPTAATELWAGHGHYPHLLDPSRFVQRVRRFERDVDRLGST